MAPSSGQQRIRPWRLLGAFLGIVVVLYTLVFATGGGNLTPKLGIDLQGGTRVTLTARTTDGAPPPRDQLVQAQEIIEQRVNGLGVSGAEVQLDGSNITITVPGDAGDQARSLGQTAQLRIREVIGQPIPATQGAAQPGGTTPGQAPAQEQPGQAPAPGGSGTPQGMGERGEQSRAVAPVAQTSPLQDPPPAPAPPPASGSSPTDPRVAAEVTELRKTRQATDGPTQAKALAALDCSAPDPLQGYDDPAKPLVACSQDKTQKFIMKPALIEGTEIASAQAGQKQQGAGYVVSLEFKPEAAQRWGDFTTKNVGKATAFVLDGEVVSAPTINQPIFGPTSIEGQFNQERAQDLAQTLRYGSLPLSFDSGTAQTVSASLGLASLEAGLIAGAVGLALVFVYCLFYYRLLGVLTILSLALSGVVVYGVLILLGRWLGFTLDLAGVAGFIISIGITADSFVIFFERLKDEMRDGRTFRSAVPRSWERARRTILTADAVSFLAAAVLYVLAVGEVRGFAFTLGMSTVLDLVVVFLVTYPLVVLISRSKSLGKPGLSGLAAVERIGARQRREAPRPGRKRTTSGKGAGE
ncbi:protein translocase subunit SecD [Pseudonocardia phyllosphaerae]|uniref:protein translocase subunit SecD n=1 Tax=Pseudonocardia phyllosphaerae TaxID=3390502 RepID=UPI00397E765B